MDFLNRTEKQTKKRNRQECSVSPSRTKPRFRQGLDLTKVPSVSRMWLDGPILRLAVVVGNLLLTPSKIPVARAVGGRKYMWVPMIVPHFLGHERAVTSLYHSKMVATSKQPPTSTDKQGADNDNDDDSTWWLTHRLLSRTNAPTIQPCKKQKPSTLDKKSKNQKLGGNDAEWAITRALVPRRFQRPNGEDTPVPGKPPAWHK